MQEMTQLMSFKQKLQQKRAILVPGAPNALAARVITTSASRRSTLPAPG